MTNHSKIILAILLILTCTASSCSKNPLAIKRRSIASEIICPNGQNYMIRHSFAREVKLAIRKDYERKVREKSNENYTAMKIPGFESFLIEKNSPDKMIECEVREGLMMQIYPRYIKYF